MPRGLAAGPGDRHPHRERGDGPLGTIDTPDSKKQVTLNGWPLYTYAKDTKPGDTTGQNVGKVWFVLDQTGTPLQAASGTSTSS